MYNRRLWHSFKGTVTNINAVELVKIHRSCLAVCKVPVAPIMFKSIVSPHCTTRKDIVSARYLNDSFVQVYALRDDGASDALVGIRASFPAVARGHC